MRGVGEHALNFQVRPLERSVFLPLKFSNMPVINLVCKTNAQHISLLIKPNNIALIEMYACILVFLYFYHRHVQKYGQFSPIVVLVMMTSSNWNIFRVNAPLCGEFTGLGEFPTQRPVTQSFDVFFDLRLNKRLSSQPWGWWFETPSWSLWRHCNEYRACSMVVRRWTKMLFKQRLK